MIRDIQPEDLLWDVISQRMSIFKFHFVPTGSGFTNTLGLHRRPTSNFITL